VSPTAALWLPWPFEYGFMQRALVVGLVVGATAPLIGVYLVQRRLALLGDGMGHVAFAGVGAGLLLGVTPVWSALVVAVLGALVLERLRAREHATGDLALALIFYSGIAAGVVMAAKGDVGSVNTNAYLFGSVLTVDATDVWTVVGLGVATIATLAIFGRALFASVLDEESARVAGIPVGVCNSLLAVMTAVTVVAAMRAVGILLVAALMVLPVASARLVTSSFRATVVWSSVIGAVSAVAGLTAARAWDLAPGGTIVLTTAFVFVVSAIVSSARAQQAARTEG
jgi:zinc transport system permease protein